MTRAPRLFWDAETRSTIDLRKTGIYPYMRHYTTDVLLVRWALGDMEPELWLRGQPLPAGLLTALHDPSIQISAHNFSFERVLLQEILGPRYGWPQVDLSRWDCTMARARACNIPASLDGALRALGANVQKDGAGHALMLRMCKPRKIHEAGQITADQLKDTLLFTLLEDGRVAEWWCDDERMTRLGTYCTDDVKGGRALDRILPDLIPAERQIWLETEEINDVGVRFDLAFCRRALQVADDARALLDVEMREVTGRAVKKASNVSNLKAWLEIDLAVPLLDPLEETDEEPAEEEDVQNPQLRRKDIERLLRRTNLPAAARRALEIRYEAGKSSTKKLNAILLRADDEGRVRGLIAYHGAGTGRESAAGSGVQIQNFPRDVLRDWDGAWREMEESGVEGIETYIGPALDTISRMLRGSIIPGEGNEIIAADYASVEARGVAWLARCSKLVDLFASGAKIYEEMAASVWRVPAKSIGKDSLERFVGKTLVLGAGYGMGAAKFAATCEAQGRGVDLTTAKLGITTYRTTFPEIPLLWREMERAAIAAVRNRGTTVRAAGERIAFRLDGKWLRMRLPSGRELRYRDPKLERDERFGADKLVYWGVDSKTKRWGKQNTYGGRLTENAVQGLCRDLMVRGKHRLREEGYRVITSVHDEIITEVRIGSNQHSVEDAVRLMCELPEWANGFPLAAEGKRAARYVK
jgi:DNA polymerase